MHADPGHRWVAALGGLPHRAGGGTGRRERRRRRRRGRPQRARAGGPRAIQGGRPCESLWRGGLAAGGGLPGGLACACQNTGAAGARLHQQCVQFSWVSCLHVLGKEHLSLSVKCLICVTCAPSSRQQQAALSVLELSGSGRAAGRAGRGAAAAWPAGSGPGAAERVGRGGPASHPGLEGRPHDHQPQR